MGTHLIKTPICVYNRQILFVPTTHIFFSKINPLNTANGHFSVSHVTKLSHIVKYATYRFWLPAHCLFLSCANNCRAHTLFEYLQISMG